MKKKTIAILIIILVYLFPFRWAFLEYPKPVNVNGTMIDGGRAEYVFYFILTIIGFLVFFFMTITDGKEKAKKN